MKTEELILSKNIDAVVFYIGQNADENSCVINKGSSEDLWFHAKNDSSCHVVAILPDCIDKKDLRLVIKKGALLCKQNTNKLKKNKEVEIIYTKIKNITETDKTGCVLTTNCKYISV